MERKDFLTMLGVGAGSIVIASCLGACGKDDTTTPVDPNKPNPNPGTVKTTVNNIAGNQDIMDKGWMITEDVIIAKSGAGYIALAAKCTHQQAAMTYNPANNTFPCSLGGDAHGSIFNSEGVPTAGAALNVDPAKRNLAKYTTKLENGTLTVFNV